MKVLINDCGDTVRNFNKFVSPAEKTGNDYFVPAGTLFTISDMISH